jgi:hypothetical protein
VEGEIQASLAARREAESTAQEIAANSDPVPDDVTGEVTEIDEDHIVRQLLEGVSAEEIVVRTKIPVVIDASGLNSSEASVFLFEEETGSLLGWVGIRNLKNAVEPLTAASPPQPGHAVEVYVRDPGGQDFWCSPGPDENPLMVIPFDEFAGTYRTAILLASGAHQRLEEYETSIAE